MDPEEAVVDFKKRRENYAKVYEPVDESDGPHVKIINSKQFVVTNIRGYLPLKVRYAVGCGLVNLSCLAILALTAGIDVKYR